MSLLKQIKWFFIDQFMFHMSGGGGGGSTTSTGTTYTTNIPEYAKPYVMSMLGAGQSELFNVNDQGNISSMKAYKPYSTNVNDYFANASPMQTQAYSSAANLQTPGQFGAGSQLAGAGGMGSLGIAGQVANTGRNYANQATNPYAVQSYMNPYLSASLAPQLAEMNRQGQLAATQAAGQATAAGAFGGTRGQLAQAEAQRNAMMAQQNLIGQGYNQAYNNAVQNMQFGANLGLQGQQAALQGYGQANQAAGTLGQLGANQLTAQQGIINLQNQMGSAQQQAEQAKINQAIQDYATAQQYPMLQLANMNALLRGLPLQNTTTQTYAPAANPISQIGALGSGIMGISKLAGGKAGGSTEAISKRGTGIDEMHLHEMLNYKE